MRSAIPFLSVLCFITIAGTACHKSPNQPAVSGLFKQHTWFVSEAISYMGGGPGVNPPGSRDTLSNTTFAITEINDSLINFTWRPFLRLQSIDSASQTVVYDTSISGTMNAVLTYYYAKDSISYEYDVYTNVPATESLKETSDYYHTIN